MKTLFFSCCLSLIQLLAVAQYPPAAGQPGSTAIHKDSSCFVGWATKCEIYRGYLNIADTTFEINGSNRVSYGHPDDATGKASNTVVSLGDKGYAILEFEYPVVNGEGWDFAVFENAFDDYFLELAFVEASSDGENFFRFPSVSLTQTEVQTGSFGQTDATKIHNLAGKYRVEYGTPFDLEEIADIDGLNINAITHIKIIDVCGSINPEYASYDSHGNIINGPWPTPFESGGFDLDAVGVINNTQNNGLNEYKSNIVTIYPNPTNDFFKINTPFAIEQWEIYTKTGVKVFYGNSKNADVSILQNGIYFIRLYSESRIYNQKLIKY